jgi:riboflavin transporter FmnP
MRKSNTKKLVSTAMFAALAFAAAFACSFIPKVAGFLSFDIKDAVIVLCALIFGPLWGGAIAIIVPLLEFIFPVGASTGWYGLIMNVLSSMTFCLVAGFIYKYKRSFYGAIVALVSGIFSVTAVMLIANIFITPLYLTYVVGAPTSMGDIIKNYIPTVLLPFNFTKATANAAIVLLLYKPLSGMLKKTRMIEYKLADNNEKKGFNVRSLIVTLIAVAVIVISVCVMFFVIK